MSHEPDVKAIHRSTIEHFTELVSQVRDDQWGDPTPCADWDVRTLVNHVLSEEKWIPPLLEGKTVAEVGADAFEGDLLADDPTGNQAGAADEASAAADAVALDSVVHISFGDVPAQEYLNQMIAEHLIHGWDLATGIGADRGLDAQAVALVTPWWDNNEKAYRQYGAVADQVARTGSDAADQLLARFGRDPSWQAPAS